MATTTTTASSITLMDPRKSEAGVASLQHLPCLDYSLKARWLSILLYWSLTLLFSMVAPIAVFYPLYHASSLSLEAVLGIVSSMMGVPQIIELFYRLYIMIRRDRGPLRDDGRKTYFDIFQVEFILGVALLVMMYVLSCSFAQPIPELFLLAPATLALFIGIQLLLTLMGFKAPFRLNSTSAGTRIKPGVFYAIEDVVGVEGGGGKAFRERWATAYHESPALRDIVRELTIWWGTGCLFVFGLSVLITFTCPLLVSFGLSLALFWTWMFVWVIASFYWWRKGSLK